MLFFILLVWNNPLVKYIWSQDFYFYKLKLEITIEYKDANTCICSVICLSLTTDLWKLYIQFKIGWKLVMIVWKKNWVIMFWNVRICLVFYLKLYDCTESNLNEDKTVFFFRIASLLNEKYSYYIWKEKIALFKAMQ